MQQGEEELLRHPDFDWTLISLGLLPQPDFSAHPSPEVAAKNSTSTSRSACGTGGQDAVAMRAAMIADPRKVMNIRIERYILCV